MATKSGGRNCIGYYRGCDCCRCRHLAKLGHKDRAAQFSAAELADLGRIMKGQAFSVSKGAWEQAELFPGQGPYGKE